MARPPPVRNLTPIAARRLVRSWDVQQEAFNPLREARFRAMLDVVDAHLPSKFRALDLGSGPGPLSVRLLRRFPRATCVAIDRDPVTLTIGRRALGSQRGRLDWLDADLGAPGWTEPLGRPAFDAALSTTALHWLPPARLRRLYRDLYRVLRPGGVLLNGDYLPWGEPAGGMTRLSEEVRVVRFGRGPLSGEWTGWRAWWRSAKRTPGLAAEFAERDRRFPKDHPHSRELSLDYHLRALGDAGFRDVGVIWQDFENRVVVALR